MKNSISSISFSNFRSIVDPISIPLLNKVTFLVGPNNSGKSNILRFLAILLNRAYNNLDLSLDFSDKAKTNVIINIDVVKKAIISQLTGTTAAKYAEDSKSDKFTFGATLSNKEINFTDSHDFLNCFPESYFHSSNFIRDNGYASGDPNQNKISLLNRLRIAENFLGTVYVPNLRFISTPGNEPPHFNRIAFPGSTIAFSNVITEIGQMDRPNQNDRHLRKKLSSICNFIEYCLEVNSVSIQVPRDNSTILVSIDGNEQPISNLGTGVEQLLMIGLASHLFAERLVLIDEPELHFHPRAQKRIMKYLEESVDAKFVIATHSAAILDSIDADVIQIESDGTRTTGRSINNNSERYIAVRNLGHAPSELIQSNYVIWVEGPSDRIYLNHWINQTDKKLLEGIDYTIIFYGGKVLSQHSFADDGSDLVNAISLSREFAIIIDSDKKYRNSSINKTKIRIKDEAEKQNGFVWITKGREMENYIPLGIIKRIASEVNGVSIPNSSFDQIVDPEKIRKTVFAQRAIEITTDEWPLDLKSKIEELVRRIRSAA